MAPAYEGQHSGGDTVSEGKIYSNGFLTRQPIFATNLCNQIEAIKEILSFV